MRKEFPPDRWLRKHLTPMRSIFAVVGLYAGLDVLYHSLPYNGKYMFFNILMWGSIAFGLGTLVWRVWWDHLHPYKVEFCKECARALPRKYDD
jgi:hypothetical protein